MSATERARRRWVAGCPPPKAGSHLLAWQMGGERGGAGWWWVHDLRDGGPARFLRGARPGDICGDLGTSVATIGTRQQRGEARSTKGGAAAIVAEWGGKL